METKNNDKKNKTTIAKKQAETPETFRSSGNVAPERRSAGVPAGSAQFCETKPHFFLSPPAALKKNAISSGPHSKQQEEKTSVSNGEKSV